MSIKRIATNAANAVGNLVLSPPYGGFGYYQNHGPRSKYKVALTFDDGPSKPSTENLIEALSELGVRATFFCLGEHVLQHPDLTQRMYAEGHVIGNHSMSHRRLSGLKLGPDDGHIDDGARAIAQVIGQVPRLYRPPWGWLSPWEAWRLHQRDDAIIGWDVYTLDWKEPEIDGRIIGEQICRDVKPGSIILLHDARSLMFTCVKAQMTVAVRYIVPILRARGYEFVTIPELLNIPAYTPPTTNDALRG